MLLPRSASVVNAADCMQAADEFERIAKALPDDEAAVKSLAAVWHTLENDQRAVEVLETFLRPPRVSIVQGPFSEQKV